jgi:hypothetical protein
MILGDFSLFCEGSNKMNKVIYWVLAMAACCGNSRACEGNEVQWAKEFAALRTVRGLFEGGSWAADVDRWQGRKHRLMQCLAAGLSTAGTPVERVVARMGEPDARVACPSAACDGVVRLMEARGEGERVMAEGTQLWVYLWRGQHDRLVFTVLAGKVSDVAWAYALE